MYNIQRHTSFRSVTWIRILSADYRHMKERDIFILIICPSIRSEKTPQFLTPPSQAHPDYNNPNLDAVVHNPSRDLVPVSPVYNL